MPRLASSHQPPFRYNNILKNSCQLLVKRLYNGVSGKSISLIIANLEDCTGTFTPERKKIILMYCLGPEGLEMYNQLQKHERNAGDLDIFKSALSDLDERFSPMLCVAVMRHTFFQRKLEKYKAFASRL